MARHVKSTHKKVKAVRSPSKGSLTPSTMIVNKKKKK